MLAMIADNRVTAKREIAPDKLNAARLRRGRPAIPPLWKVGPSPIVEIYTTKIVPAQMHGKKQWRPSLLADSAQPARASTAFALGTDRACQIGELAKHLTRTRSYYELNPGKGETP